MLRLRRWLLHKIIRRFYLGINEDDVIDLSRLVENDQNVYLSEALEVNKNRAFQAELLRLRYQQEKILATKAKTEEDLIFGRSVLYTIELISKRFETLANRAIARQEEQKRDVPVSKV